MLAATIERHPDRVECRGLRHGLRIRIDLPNILRVEGADMTRLRWKRVDQNLVALTRAASRLLAADPPAARTLVAHAVELADVPARDMHPVTGLVRAVYPLLASPPPWPVATLPATIPPALQPAFRARDPRTAAHRLFGDRATRPVARALAQLLTGRPTPDLFVLTVALAAAPQLEPDHLVRLLDCTGAAGVDRSPLPAGDTARLRDLLADTRPRRVVARLAEAIEHPTARRRLRFVAATCPPQATLDLRAGWDQLALHAMTATP